MNACVAMRTQPRMAARPHNAVDLLPVDVAATLLCRCASHHGDDGDDDAGGGAKVAAAAAAAAAAAVPLVVLQLDARAAGVAPADARGMLAALAEIVGDNDDRSGLVAGCAGAADERQQQQRQQQRQQPPPPPLGGPWAVVPVDEWVARIRGSDDAAAQLALGVLPAQALAPGGLGGEGCFAFPSAARTDLVRGACVACVRACVILLCFVFYGVLSAGACASAFGVLLCVRACVRVCG